MEKKKLLANRLQQLREATGLRVPTTEGIAAISQLQRLVDTANIADSKTVALASLPDAYKYNYVSTTAPAAITSSKKRVSMPRFYEHKYNGLNPLEMIYTAIIECQKRYHCLPDCVFIAATVERYLIQEYRKYTGEDYTGHFYFARNNKTIEMVPIYPEKLLPDFLKQALESTIPPNTAIALIEK